MKTVTTLLLLPLVAAGEPANFRKPANDGQLRYWLENMVVHHRYTAEEVTKATGMTAKEIEAAEKRFGIRPENRPKRSPDDPLKVLPYPGGRHPRIGFLDGAIRPRRETKVSIFAPWDEDDFVVADVPEAIWSNLGLTYLAHTHVDTVWSKKKVVLEKLEWDRKTDGSLVMERELPNGIRFGTKVMPGKELVRMEMWLLNGSSKKLTSLRVQNCVMLKNAKKFNRQTDENKLLKDGWCACRSEDGKRWIVTGWQPIHRAWANTRVPCLHADPQFPDCEPGKTVRLRGYVSFFEGKDVEKAAAKWNALIKE